MIVRKLILSLMMSLLGASVAFGHGSTRPEPVTLAEGIAAFGWNYDVDVKTEKIAEGFYVLFGVGGNVAVSSGPDGVLIVDDQVPEMVPKLQAAMRQQGDKAVDFVINTHWHVDHAGSNQGFGAAGSLIIAHDNVRERLAAGN